MVHAVSREAPRRGPPDAATASGQPFRRPPAALRARAPVLVSVHDAEGASRNRCVVASRARGRLCTAGVPPRHALMSSRSAFRAVVFLVLLASCSLPRPTVGLAIAGTTVPASRA